MADRGYDVLAAELRALGGAVPERDPSAGLLVAVMERVADLPTPVRSSVPRLPTVAFTDVVATGRRRAAVVVTAVLVALLVTPPVRAAVADWFGFGGVMVRNSPIPGPTAAASPPPAGTATSLREARRQVDFTPVLPSALGAPEGIEVSGDGRVLSTSWDSERDGAIRLDQFDGRLDYTFAKTSPGVEFTAVAGDFALWFDEPHEVVVLDPDGSRRTETARLAGHTLIWQRGGVTLRLEADVPLARALEIAATVDELP